MILPQNLKNQCYCHDICISYAGSLQTPATGNNFFLVFVDTIKQLD